MTFPRPHPVLCAGQRHVSAETLDDAAQRVGEQRLRIADLTNMLIRCHDWMNTITNPDPTAMCAQIRALVDQSRPVPPTQGLTREGVRSDAALSRAASER
jgi:hypothetical protein